MKNKPKIKSFNVIFYDFNSKKFESYDVIPYLLEEYQKKKDELKSFEDIKSFIESTSKYQWWSRCQYELILTDWPNEYIKEKWDIHKQVMMNIDIITTIIIENGN